MSPFALIVSALIGLFAGGIVAGITTILVLTFCVPFGLEFEPETLKAIFATAYVLSFLGITYETYDSIS